MEKVHYKIHLQGKVQGVGFRYTAKEVADKLNLYGYARNMRDGTVTIESEGSKDKLEQFLSWCKTDSYKTNIEQIGFEEKEIEGYREFSVF